MLLSNYNINKALIELNPVILINTLTDDLISICDKQHYDWENDTNSKEYKFLKMLSDLNNESYTLSVLNKFFYIIYLEIYKYANTDSDYFSLIDDFDLFVSENKYEYNLDTIELFLKVIRDYDEDYNKYMILRCMNIISDPYSIKQNIVKNSVTTKNIPEHYLLSPQVSYSSRYGNKYLNNAEELYFKIVAENISDIDIPDRFPIITDIKNKILNTNHILEPVSVGDLSNNRKYEEPLLLYKPWFKHQFSNNNKINSLILDILNLHEDDDLSLTDGEFDDEFDSFLKDILMVIEEKEINISELYRGLYNEAFGDIGNDNYHYNDSGNKVPTTYNVIKNIYSGDDKYIGYPELKKYKFLLWYTICERRYNEDYQYDIICRPSTRKDSTYIVPVFYQTEEGGPFYKYPEGTEIPKEFITDGDYNYKTNYYYDTKNDSVIEYSRRYDFYCMVSDIIYKYLNSYNVSDNYRKYLLYYTIKDQFIITDDDKTKICDLETLKYPEKTIDRDYTDIIGFFREDCIQIKSALNIISEKLLESGKFKKVVDY